MVSRVCFDNPLNNSNIIVWSSGSLLGGTGNFLSTNNSKWLLPFGISNCANEAKILIPTNIILTGLYVKLSNAPTTGQWVVTVFKNSKATSLSLTIANNSFCNSISDYIMVRALEELSILVTSVADNVNQYPQPTKIDVVASFCLF